MSAVPTLMESGIFTVPEIAKLVGQPQARVRTWISGRGDQAPIIENQLGRVTGREAVSFSNLLELRFVAVFAAAGLDLRKIRRVFKEAKETLDHPHPFATSRCKVTFGTDGGKILATITLGDRVVIYDLESRNYEITEVVQALLRDDVVYDPDGDAVAWFPRKEIAPHVVVSPAMSFGRPVLVDSGVPVETIAHAVRVEGNEEIVSSLYEVPLEQVHEAVLFEQELRLAA